MDASLLQETPACPAPSAPAGLLRTHRFGGSSLADAARIRHVADLLLAADEARQVTVVSAMQGVTDALIGLADTAAAGDDWRPRWTALRDRHADAATALAGEHPA